MIRNWKEIFGNFKNIWSKLLKKIIFVNATAATDGGALTILRQFLEGIATYSNKNMYYYIFCY